MKGKIITYAHAILSIIGVIIQSLLMISFYNEYNPLGYSFAQYTDRLIIAIATYLFAIFSFGIVTYYTTLSIKIIGDERKRNSLIFLRNFYLFLFTAILVLMIGVVYLASSGLSTSTINVLNSKIYPYPLSIGAATILAFVAIINLLLFGVNEYMREVDEKLAITSILMLLLGIFISIWPNNYYGVYSLKDPPDIRLYTNLLLLVYYLISLILMTPRLYIKSRSVRGISAFRFKVISLGYIVGLGFFIFYMLDTIYGGGLPYTFWMFFSWASLIGACFMLYLGILTPSWLERRIRAK